MQLTVNSKGTLLILFWSISSLLLSKLTAQVNLIPQNCNNLEVNLLMANTSSASLIYSLEKEVAPEVWKEYDKRKRKGEREIFEDLERGIYRAKCILPSGYFAKRNNMNSVLVSAAYEIGDCDSLSKGNKIAIQNISISPNPASKKIKIEINPDLLNKEFIQIHLSDLNGKRLKKILLDSSSTEIEISNLNAGIYLLQLMNDEVTIHIEKLVVL